MPEIDFSFLSNITCETEFNQPEAEQNTCDDFLPFDLFDDDICDDNSINKENTSGGDSQHDCGKDVISIKSYEELISMDGNCLALLDSNVFKESVDPKNGMSRVQALEVKDKRRIYKNRNSARRSAQNKDSELQLLRQENTALQKQLKQMARDHAQRNSVHDKFMRHYDVSLQNRGLF